MFLFNIKSSIGSGLTTYLLERWGRRYKTLIPRKYNIDWTICCFRQKEFYDVGPRSRKNCLTLKPLFWIYAKAFSRSAASSLCICCCRCCSCCSCRCCSHSRYCFVSVVAAVVDVVVATVVVLVVLCYRVTLCQTIGCYKW